MFKLTIGFTRENLKPEVEFFEKKHAAVYFAKMCYRDGYTTTRDEKELLYPSHFIGPMSVEEVEDDGDFKQRVHPTQIHG